MFLTIHTYEVDSRRFEEKESETSGDTNLKTRFCAPNFEIVFSLTHRIYLSPEQMLILLEAFITV